MRHGEAASWEAESFQRERVEAIAVLLLSGILMPLFGVLDYALRPAVFPVFMALRAGNTAIALLLVIPLRRARTAFGVRACSAIMVAAVGLTTSHMVAVEPTEFELAGFSLYFFAVAAILSWPVGWFLGVSILVLISYPLAIELAHPEQGAASSADAVAQLVTAVAIASSVLLMRRRGLRRVFVAHRELANALRSLQETQGQLVDAEKRAALGRLLAGLSHEINNPVTILQNNLAPLRAYYLETVALLDAARAPGSGPEEVARRWQEADVEFMRRDFDDAVDGMQAASERIHAILTDLRAFVRGDAIAPVEADLIEGLEATANLLQRHLPPRVRLRQQYGTVPRFAFHPGQINQVILNLLQNALDAVGDDGEVELRAEVRDGQVEISVTDTGPGIDEALVPRLFEPFFTTKPVGKGTGLGLAISSQIVEAHGGVLELDRSHAPGARFVVRLPLRRP